MRKRIEPTIVEQAIENVAGFNQVFKKLEQQIILKGQSSSILHNYICRIARTGSNQPENLRYRF